MLSAEQEQHARDRFGEAQTVRITRTGERDLGFVGWEIGKSESEYSVSRLTVTIYVTTKGNFVTRIDRLPMVRMDPPPEVESKAAAHTYPELALQWLIDDHGSSLGPSSKAAWEQACRNWPELAPYEMETV